MKNPTENLAESVRATRALVQRLQWSLKNKRYIIGEGDKNLKHHRDAITALENTLLEMPAEIMQAEKQLGYATKKLTILIGQQQAQREHDAAAAELAHLKRPKRLIG